MSNPQKNEPKYIWLIHQLNALVDELHAHSENCIPSERELCERFGVSRITVRRALAELEEGGTIYRVQGKGAFVCKAKLQQPLMHLTSFTEDMHKQNMIGGARILALETVPALPRIAEALHIEENAPVILLKRLRLSGARPIAIENCYLTYAIGCTVKKYIADDVSLYAILREKCELSPIFAEQTFEVGILQPWEQSLLGSDAPPYALSTTRKTYDENCQPIEYVESKYRGDSYSYQISMKAELISGQHQA